MNRQLRRALNRYQPFFMPVSVIAAAVAIFFLVIIPVTQRTITRFEEISEAEEQLVVLRNKLSVLNGADEIRLEELLNTAVSAISIEKSLPSILRTVETLANDSNVILDSVAFDEASKLASESGVTLSNEERQFGAYRIPFTVTTSSGFSELRAFLENTMNIRRFVRARSFILNFGDEDQTSTQIKFDSFYLPLQTGNPARQVTALNTQEEELLRRVAAMKDGSSLLGIEETTEEPVDTGQLRNPFQ